MGLSIIIPSKLASNLSLCLRALVSMDPGHRVFLVDDGLDWDWLGWEVRMPPNLTVLEGIKPFIFARNINLGMAAAAPDDVILLNDDAMLETPGGFTALQRAALEQPEYGLVGAVTNVTGQPLQHPRGTGAIREVPHFAFVCAFVPRSTIDRVGPLDERYFLDYGVEDLDYCEMARRAGLKCGVFDGCYVNHGELVSTFRGDPRTPKSFEKNYGLFKQKWGIA